MLTRLNMLRAEMLLSRHDFSAACSAARKGLALDATEPTGHAAQAIGTLGLSLSFARDATGNRFCEEAARLAEQDKQRDPWLFSRSLLVLAECQLNSGDARNALGASLRAEEMFARTGQRESQWRAWLFAGLAARSTGDRNAARDLAAKAEATLRELERVWGAEAYSGYLSRPDIQRLLSQLEGLKQAGQ